MSVELYVNLDNCITQARIIAEAIQEKRGRDMVTRVHGVPRGGIPVAMLVVQELRAMGHEAHITQYPSGSHAIVDDLIDSGATRDRYVKGYINTSFYALYNKQSGQLCNGCAVKDKWLVFPWEVTDDTANDADMFTRLIQFVGEDPTRDGLKDTPERMTRAWREWTNGYEVNIAELLTTFKNDKDYDQMITVRRIPFYSHCEHHLAPFFGTADISYIPANGKIVGLSKLSRVLTAFANRLQVQERLTQQVASAIMTCLQPAGVGVIVRARHLCMESRGIAQQGSETYTTALLGCYKDSEVKQEFLNP